MWYCMKHRLASDLTTCQADITLDKDNATCKQTPICEHKQASYDVMPAGKVDCQWEYSQVLSEADNLKHIDEKCSALACSCMRRGSTGLCKGQTSCCINGNPWDTSVVTDATVTYEQMSCDDIDVCLPAVTYCKLVQEPELMMPDECKGYALGLYTTKASARSTCQSKARVLARGQQCNDAPGNACELITAASLAKCNTIPHMYQVCRSDATVDAVTGACVCTNVSHLVTTCHASGDCIYTPLPQGPICTVAANCSNHASAAEVDAQGLCQCTCTGSWTGATCSSDSSNDVPILMIVIAACAVVLCVAIGFAVYCVKSRNKKCEPCLNEQLLEMKGKDIVIHLPPSNPTSSSSTAKSKDDVVLRNTSTPTPTMASLPASSMPPSANPTPVLLPTAAPQSAYVPAVIHHQMTPQMMPSATPTPKNNPMVSSAASTVLAASAAAAPTVTPVLKPAVPHLTPKTPPEAQEWGKLKPVEKAGDGYRPHRRRSSTISVMSPEMHGRRTPSPGMRRTPSPALSAALSIATTEQRMRRESGRKRRSSSKMSVAGEPQIIKKRRSRTPPPRGEINNDDITRALAELTRDLNNNKKSKSRRSRSNTTALITDHSFSPLATSRRGPPPSFSVNKMTL
eukprot:TRINITY_DN15158_c0_g1_i2.p1 TRINITY_DN15158_c0_g1~~TRINITY_DN15158_c0_g1_i2.p1  ORF type:complete len:736 (+),score=199.82 TRINITY_DN15158_c0_g1_i2:328-2208(+)